MSARLLIEFVQVFFVDFLMRFERHPAVSANLEGERANPAHYRHDRAEKKPNRHSHVLSRFAIFRAGTKWTRDRLVRDEQERSDRRKGDGEGGVQQDRENRYRV